MAPPTMSSREMGILHSKFDDPDSDIRFMSLVDLYNYLESVPPGLGGFLAKDHRECALLIDKLLKLLDDTNGDVQSQALKCIGPLAVRSPHETLSQYLEKLTRVEVPKSQDRSIPATSSRYFVLALPRPISGIPPTPAVSAGYEAVSKVMIPRLLGHLVYPLDTKPKAHLKPPSGMLEIDSNGAVDADSIDLLNETVRCFGPLFKPEESEGLLKKLWEILEHQNVGNIGKKKAISGFSILAVYLSDEALSKLVSTVIESLRASHLSNSQRRALITLLGAISRTIPRRFGVYLKTIAEFVLQALSKDEYDELLQGRDEDGTVDPESEEVREAALITLEDFLSSCVNEMRPFTDEALEASLRYIAYDPRIVNDSDDEMGGTQTSVADGDIDEDDEFDVEEDFEEEEGLDDDDDDTSWKIRRCAAKSLQGLIQTRLNDLMESGILYEKIAPFLVKRFSEREENVRLEVLAIMSFVIAKTAENSPAVNLSVSEEAVVETSRAGKTRKRPRGRSDASMFDEPRALDTPSPGQTPSPVTGPRAEIGSLGPAVANALGPVFSQKSVPVKQAAVILLREFANLRHGSLNDHLGQIVDPVVSIVKATGGFAGGSAVVSSGGAASATGNSLRMESLEFLRVICETHSSKAIAPYLQSMVSGVTSAIEDKYFKVSCSAITAAEGIIKALTPPRALGSDQKSSGYIGSIFKALLSKMGANDTDLEVRLRAIHAMGVCLVRTSGSSKLLSAEDRNTALSSLQERLRNETTRLMTVEAIDSLAAASEKGDLNETWVRSVAGELSNQLRKADLRLRAASLGALKRLAANPSTIGSFDGHLVESLTEHLLPLLNVANLGTLGLAVNILTNLVQKSASKVVSTELTNALCNVVTSTMSGPTLDSFLELISVIGRQGEGASLMKDLLSKASLSGEPTIVGAAIGTLIVSGGSSVGVGQQDIMKELKTAVDDQRRCLALCIMGEVSLRQGVDSSIKPQTFLDHFNSKSDQVRRVAAVSLGRAGAGNIPLYLPLIISTLQASDRQSLLLHSVKEILQFARKSKDGSDTMDILWERIINIADTEDNKAIGAECLGRLVVFAPGKYLESLQAYLQGPKASVRGLSIQAIRFALGDPDETLDHALKPLLIPFLMTMLIDTDLENRRLALTTLNSAVKHKPALVLGNLQQVVPFVIKSTMPDASLIKEVQMGPFKHKVDDGLENRKSAYETLHALMSAAYARLDHLDLYDRVIAGLGDDSDIKTLCNLMLTKLVDVDPDETARRLDAFGEKFQATLSTKLKENAVKQEVEKQQEAVKDVLRTTVLLQDKFPGAATSVQVPQWRNYCDMLARDFQPQLASAQHEIKTQA